MIIKQHRNKHFNLRTSLIVLAIVVVIGSGFIYVLKTRLPQQDSSSNGPTPEQQKAMQEVDNNQKKAFAESTKGVDNPGVAVPTPSSPDTIELSANKTDASTVTILTKLHNYAGGNCEITVVNGAKEYSVSAEILYQPEYSTCAGFSIPVSELGLGSWAIKLTATPVGGNPVTKTRNFEVR